MVQAALASPSNLRSFSLTGLFVLAIFYTLYFAADFALPVALALLMSLLLLPLVALLGRMKIPEAIGSAIAIIILMVVLVGLASLIYQPAASFMQDFPHHLQQIQERLAFLSASLKQAGHTSEQFQQLMVSGQASTTVVTFKQQGLIQVFLSQTPVFGETDRGDHFSLFSLGTPGSFPPQSGQSSPDLPRQASNR